MRLWSHRQLDGAPRRCRSQFRRCSRACRGLGREHPCAADAAVSLGVVIAGIVILSTGWLWLDPAVSLAIAAIIFLGTWRLLRGSVNLALDAVPEGIEPDAVRRYLVDLPDVEKMHDLHI